MHCYRKIELGFSSFFFFCSALFLFGGHILHCSGLTPAFAHRDHSKQCSEDYGISEKKSKSAMCQASTPLAILLLWPWGLNFYGVKKQIIVFSLMKILEWFLWLDTCQNSHLKETWCGRYKLGAAGKSCSGRGGIHFLCSLWVWGGHNALILCLDIVIIKYQ